MPPTRREAAEEYYKRKLARRSLLDFCAYTHPQWQSAEHHRKICELLERVERGEVKRAIIEAPPRHGKSEVVSRRFAAWYLGKNPGKEIISTAYSADLAVDEYGRKVRNIVGDQLFRNVFPGVKLAEDSKAAGRWNTNHGGGYIAAGVHGGITGRGANCIAEGQRVLTRFGWAPIETIRVGDIVFTHRGRWRQVTAVKQNGVRRVLKVTGRYGNVVCTDDHKLLSKDGWRAAEEPRALFEADMRTLWRSVCAERPVAQQEAKATILHGAVQQGVRSREVGCASGEAPVCSLWEDPQERFGEVLLSGVQVCARTKHREHDQAFEDYMPDMSACLQTRFAQDCVLLDEVQGRGTQHKDGWQGEPELQDRGLFARLHTALQTNHFSSDEAWSIVRGLRLNASALYAPHRPEQEEQRSDEPDRDLFEMPSRISQIEEFGEARVYDIQVDGDSSFVVEGFIAHNCFLIDDPFAGRADADSEKERAYVWSWYDAEAKLRLAPNGAIVIVNTRWHSEDLVGLVLKHHVDDNWEVLKLPAISNDGGEERALWPERFSLEHLQKLRANYMRSHPREWYALYQQQPTTDSGTYIERAWFTERYENAPAELNVYIVSDFAITEAQEGKDPDHTEHGVFGVAPDDKLYVLDWWHGQTTTDVWVEELLRLVKQWKPLCWFGEGGVVGKSMQPIIDKLMRQRKIYCRTERLNPIHDKASRGRAFQGRAHAGDVMFPRSEWAERVINQCVAFPGGAHDDAFDVCAWMGLAIDQAHPAIATPVRPPKKRRDYKEEVSRETWKIA